MHTYVYIHVRMREAEQPSRKNPHVSLRTKVTMQDRKKKPHTKKIYRKKTWSSNSDSVECKVPQTLMGNEVFIAQILDLQLPWNVQWDELLVKQTEYITNV